MKVLFKSIGIALGLLLALLIIIPLVFKDKIKAMVQEELDKSLRAEVRMEGVDLHLIRSFPNMTLVLNGLSVVNRAPFEGDTLFVAKAISAKLNLWEVVSGSKITIRAIALDEPRIRALVNAQGEANWDITYPDTTQTEPQVEDEVSEPMLFSINKYEIENGYLYYLDSTYNMAFEAQGLNHRGSFDLAGDITHMTTTTTIENTRFTYEGVDYLRRVKADAAVKLDYDLAQSLVTLRNNAIQLNDMLLEAEGTVDMGDSTRMGFDLSFKAPKTDFKALISLIPAVYYKDFEQVKTSGTFSLTGFVEGFYGPADTDMPAFGLDIAIADGYLAYPDLPAALEKMNARIVLNKPQGDLNLLTLNLQPFKLQLAGSSITLGLGLSNMMTDPLIDLMVVGKADLAKVSKALPGLGMDLSGRVTADVVLKGAASALEAAQTDKITARGQFTMAGFNYLSPDMPPVRLDTLALVITPQTAHLPELRGMAGKTDFQASGKLSNLSAWLLSDSTLKGGLTGSSKLVDVNEWMPAEPAAETASTETSSEADAPATAESTTGAVEIPGNLNLSLDWTVDRIVYDDLKLTEAAGSMGVANHRLSAKNLSLKVEEQLMVMKGYYETLPGTAPRAQFSFAAPDLSLQTIYNTFDAVKKYAPLLGQASGSAALNMDMTTELLPDMSPNLNTLYAKGVLKTKDVLIQSDALKGLGDALKNPDFSKIRTENADLSFKVEQGRLIIDPVKAKLGTYTATFSGSNSLEGALDYTLGSKMPVGDLPGVSQLAAAAGIQGGEVDINVLIGGNFAKPTYSLKLGNMSGGLKEQLVDKAKEEAQKVLDEALKAAKAQGDALLAQAREQADALVAESKKRGDQIRAEGKRQANNIRAEAKKQADKLVADAGNDMIKKIAAQKAGELAVKEAANQAAKVEAGAEQQATKLEAEARKQGDQLVAAAQKKADDLLKAAAEQAKLK